MEPPTAVPKKAASCDADTLLAESHVHSVILSMEEIWHPPVEVGSLSHYLQGFIH